MSAHIPPEYPQSTRMAETQDSRLAVLEFLEWLDGQGIALMRELEPSGQIANLVESDDALVLRWLGIDAKALEDERRATLKGLQS